MKKEPKEEEESSFYTSICYMIVYVLREKEE